MVVKDGKIVACTDDELYSYWLKNWSEFMAFDEYSRKMKAKGVKISEDKRDNNQCGMYGDTE